MFASLNLTWILQSKLMCWFLTSVKMNLGLLRAVIYFYCLGPFCYCISYALVDFWFQNLSCTLPGAPVPRRLLHRFDSGNMEHELIDSWYHAQVRCPRISPLYSWVFSPFQYDDHVHCSRALSLPLLLLLFAIYLNNLRSASPFSPCKTYYSYPTPSAFLITHRTRWFEFAIYFIVWERFMFLEHKSKQSNLSANGKSNGNNASTLYCPGCPHMNYYLPT